MKELNKILYFVIGLLCLLIMITFYAKTYLYVVISFNTNGGNKIDDKKVIRREKIGKLPIPIKDGYTFSYWLVDNEKIDEDYIVIDNIVLTAIYEKNKEEENLIVPSMNIYTIKYDTDGGTRISDYTIVEGEKAKKPDNPVKEGYEFKEWTLNGKLYDFNVEVTSDIVLKAIYEKKATSDLKLTAFRATAKLILTTAEKNFLVEQALDPFYIGGTYSGLTGDNSCEKFTLLSSSDYESCKVVVDINGNATLNLNGKLHGKFSNYTCKDAKIGTVDNDLTCFKVKS